MVTRFRQNNASLPAYKKLSAVHRNAGEVRRRFEDWDFFDEGLPRRAFWRPDLTKSVETQHLIMDFVCSTRPLREIIAANVKIFMNTIVEGRVEDTNKLFESPADSEKVSYTI